ADNSGSVVYGTDRIDFFNFPSIKGADAFPDTFKCVSDAASGTSGNITGQIIGGSSAGDTVDLSGFNPILPFGVSFISFNVGGQAGVGLVGIENLIGPTDLSAQNKVGFGGLDATTPPNFP